jgi:hypothetical protein
VGAAILTRQIAANAMYRPFIALGLPKLDAAQRAVLKVRLIKNSSPEIGIGKIRFYEGN